MKCPACAYFNLPGIEACGRCGRALVAADEKMATWSDVSPPRARNRTARQKFDSQISPVSRLALSTAERAARAAPGRVAALANARIDAERSAVWNLRLAAAWWLMPVLSLVPGLGQLFQRRFAIAAILAATFGFSLFFWFLTIKSVASHTSLLIVPLLCVYSIYDAADRSFPPAEIGPARFFRSLRLLMIGFFLTSMTIFAGLSALQARFSLMIAQSVRGQVSGSPVIESSDGLAFERLEIGRPLKRGDIVLMGSSESIDYYETSAGPNISRVVALAGARVQTRDGQVLVNGRAIPRDWLPEKWVPPANYDAVVAKKSLWLGWILFNYAAFNEGEAPERDLAPPSFSVTPISQIDGRLRAIYNPPHRRRLVP